MKTKLLKEGPETVGGHIKEGTVRPTLELILEQYPGYLQKRVDPESGLTLIDLDAARAR